jgi:SagB-type dehydrogenase family enzyme
LPRTRDFAVSPPQDVSRTWQLCRFAWLHRVGDDLVLECPDAMCAALVHHPELIKWIYRASAATAFRADQEEAAVMALLGELGFLVNPEEQESAAQRTWEFHDRMFHRRSQLFEDFQPRGGTYRFRTDGADSSSEPVPSPPAVRPAYAGEAIDLPIPSRDDGASLREVMERRRSKRAMGSSPATLAQVAELLYRVARTRDVREAPVQDLVDRPYPSGGAIHELEFYLAIHRCSGLAPGFFHYRGAEHGLTRLTGAEPIAKAMIADCAEAWGRPDRLPDCLIVLSSRLPRLAWKYEAIAYKISLMNAGVVLQSLYLVSTDLGLNGAAVGSSRPDLFGAATGNSSWEETSIAGFGFGGG